MSSGSTPKKKKGSRVGGMQLPPNRLTVAWDMLKRADVITRIGMCVLAGLSIWLVTQGWKAPFAFREGDIPLRSITSRVEFKTVNVEGTDELRRSTRRKVITVYRHQRDQIEQLRAALFEMVDQVRNADSLESLDEKIWPQFMTGVDSGRDGQDPITDQTRFTEFKTALANEVALKDYKSGVFTAMKDMDDYGLLENLQHDFDTVGGSVTEIRIAPAGSDSLTRRNVEQVKIKAVQKRLKTRLEQHLAPILAQHTYAWFSVENRLKSTLVFDAEATKREADAESASVEEVMKEYLAGSTLAEGGEPIKPRSIALLRKEHAAAVQNMGWPQMLAYTVANFGMYAAIFSLCGFYSLFRKANALHDTRSLMRVLILGVVTIMLCVLVSQAWSASVLIPLLLFAMTVVVAYDQELALLLSSVTALIVVVSLGFGLTEFTVYVASMSTAVLCLRHIRSRTKLIYVGLVTASIATATAIGVATLSDSPLGAGLLTSALWYGFCAIVAGALMSASLPFIEHLFDVQTELSLLELGDVAHPLLQELVRRAPGTYNHSITVASIAEAAAESIGANGLLVRVGAYFHDIGKMVKPGYFIENQSNGDNRHESLLPAMSTLVIIAHVKDGADLARRHGLPNALIDFIMQHHGTTLVEYFYNRANEQSESDPDAGEVDEHSYRYPGPKPQSKEAAVLMMSDAVESAGRSLTDPTPSRIEGLVEALSMKRLLDGQFDDCGLTLQELHKVQISLTKSLSAVYHGRIKYPDQQSA